MQDLGSRYSVTGRTSRGPSAATLRRLFLAAVAAGAVVAAGTALAGDPQHVGQAKCKACHLNEHKTWAASAHSRAMESLKPEERTKAECLACHSTGQGKAVAEGADLAGVQCEACHGPGSDYKSMKIMSKTRYKEDPAGARKDALAAGLVLPDEKTCLACHNDKSPTFKGFDYASAREAIKHWD